MFILDESNVSVRFLLPPNKFKKNGLDSKLLLLSSVRVSAMVNHFMSVNPISVVNVWKLNSYFVTFKSIGASKIDYIGFEM